MEDALRLTTRTAFRQRPPAQEQQEPDSTIVSRATGAVTSGLSALGNALDLPGSMVRDTLTLRNPFDQLLSPLQDKNRTTGRQMLRDFGLASKKDTWLNFVPGLSARNRSRSADLHDARCLAAH